MITVNAYNPGLVPGTGFMRDYHWVIGLIGYYVLPWLIRFLPNAHTAQESGSALASLAVKSDYQGITGKYFNVLTEKKSSELSYDENIQKELWSGSIKLCNLQQNETIVPLQ